MSRLRPRGNGALGLWLAVSLMAALACAAPEGTAGGVQGTAAMPTAPADRDEFAVETRPLPTSAGPPATDANRGLSAPIATPTPSPPPPTAPASPMSEREPTISAADRADGAASTPAPGSSAAATATAEAPITAVPDINAYLHSGPDTYDPVIGNLMAGERVTVLAISTDGLWLYVVGPSVGADEGWVYINLVRLDGDVQSLPVSERISTQE